MFLILLDWQFGNKTLSLTKPVMGKCFRTGKAFYRKLFFPRWWDFAQIYFVLLFVFLFLEFLITSEIMNIFFIFKLLQKCFFTTWRACNWNFFIPRTWISPVYNGKKAQVDDTAFLAALLKLIFLDEVLHLMPQGKGILTSLAKIEHFSKTFVL